MRASICLLCLAALLGGCGGVDVHTQGADPLRLLDLSPRLGEVGVSPETDVVAVFSAGVEVGTGAGEVQETTFSILDGAGLAVGGALSLSALDPELATVVFRPDTPFAAGAYTVWVSGELTGRTDDGPTDPLGVDIRSGFAVGP